MTLLVGTAQASYYEQAAAANLKVPMGQLGQCRPGLRAQALHPAQPRQHACHDQLHRRGRHAGEQGLPRRSGAPSTPNEPYINQEAENSYHAIYLYKQMVERAGSTDRDDDPRA